MNGVQRSKENAKIKICCKRQDFKVCLQEYNSAIDDEGERILNCMKNNVKLSHIIIVDKLNIDNGILRGGGFIFL